MAAGLAAELKRGLNLEAELIEGGGGIFQVHLDGAIVFDKEKTGRFPILGEVLETLTAKYPDLVE